MIGRPLVEHDPADVEEGTQIPLEPHPAILPEAIEVIGNQGPCIIDGSIAQLFHFWASRADRPPPIKGRQRDIIADRGHLDLGQRRAFPDLVGQEADVVHGLEVQRLARHQILASRYVPKILNRQGNDDLTQLVGLGGREHALETPDILGRRHRRTFADKNREIPEGTYVEGIRKDQADLLQQDQAAQVDV